MPIYNIFSNIWLYLSINKINALNEKNKYGEEKTLINKISKTHYIDKIIYIDSEFAFWNSTHFNGYNEVILQQIQDNNDKELANRFNKLIKLLLKYMITTEESIMLVSFQYPEILITFYIYMIAKTTKVSLANAIKIYNGKIQGLHYNLDNKLNRFLLLNCSN